MNKINNQHNPCSGGNVTGKSAGLRPIARQAVNDNSKVQGIDLKRKIERDTGLKVSHRTATRMKTSAREASALEKDKSYQLLPAFCAELEKKCPGSVAVVEVRLHTRAAKCALISHFSPLPLSVSTLTRGVDFWLKRRCLKRACAPG